ncbi:MAG: hypothetical protein AB8G14_08490 [Ilumatobacter sp.]
MRRQARKRRCCLVVAAAALIATSCGSEANESAPTTTRAPVTSAEPAATSDTIAGLTTAQRVDLAPTGNRVIEGVGALFTTDPIIVELPGDRSAAWIVPSGDSEWTVMLDDGAIVSISVDGNAASTSVVDAPPFDSGAGPLLIVEGELTTFDSARALFADPLTDTRVTSDGSQLVALGGPTERYGHAVLGDAIEASTIEVIDADGTRRTPVSITAPDVFEAVSPMLADVNGDSVVEAVMTVSNSDGGARLVAYDLDTGSVVAESDPIGLGNRWRNLLAVAPVGPAGELEAIDIRTPHIGGTLQFFQVVDGRFELTASADTYSTHRIGSRNLDLGIVTDANGDGTLDVLLPNQDMNELVAITRDDTVEGGTREVGRLRLDAGASTNIAATARGNGVAYAVGLRDGTLRIWPA